VDPRRLTIVQMPAFAAGWARLGLNDDDLRLLIMADPQRSPVIPGLAGVRKLRFAATEWKIGRRGGARVCYVYYEFAGVVVLLAVFTKSSQADLTPQQKKQIRALVAEIETYLRDKAK
jgi:hypothetical protein